MKLFNNFVLAAILMKFASVGAAQTWTQTSAVNTNWSSIASSADGSILYAAGGTTNYQWIYVSTNSGFDWTPTAEPIMTSRYVLAASADGATVVAARNLPLNTPVNFTNNFPFFISTNFGASWVPNGNPTTNDTSSIAMSADGNVIMAGVMSRRYLLSQVYISTNGGAIWQSNSVPELFNGCQVLVSSNGKRLSVLSPRNYYLTSTNGGLTWTTNLIPGSAYTWSKAATSADGNLVVASGGPGGGWSYVALSTNAGTTWATKLLSKVAPPFPGGVASSADGTKLYVATVGYPIFVSTDSGATWSQPLSLGTNWQGLVSSADGAKLAAVAGSTVSTTNGIGGIWTSFALSPPVLNLAASSSNLTLSWTLSSTNYLLQQCGDLSALNWLTITNTPVLNLTNLQNQLNLTLPASNVFYRLKTP